MAMLLLCLHIFFTAARYASSAGRDLEALELELAGELELVSSPSTTGAPNTGLA